MAAPRRRSGWDSATTRPTRSPPPGTRRSCGSAWGPPRYPNPPTESFPPGPTSASAAAEIGLSVRGQARVAVGQPGGHPGRRRDPGRGGRRPHPGHASETARSPCSSSASCPGAEVAVEGLLVGGESGGAGGVRQARSPGRPLLRRDHLRHAVTPAAGDPRRDRVHRGSGRRRHSGLREGPVHAELRIGPGGTLTILELAARSIGGLCARALRFGAGVSLEEVIIRHALGLGLDGLTRESQASGVMMLPIRSAGVLDRVSGQERPWPSTEWSVSTSPSRSGATVVPLPEGDRYLGFIFARGPTPHDGRSGPPPGRGVSRRAPALSQTWRAEAGPIGSPVVRVLLVSTYELGHQPLHVGQGQRRAARGWSPGSLCRRGRRRARRPPMSTGPTGWRSRCRCTPPCAWHCGSPKRYGPGDPSFRCASTASMPRSAGI